jgi:predicted DNA-binding protein
VANSNPKVENLKLGRGKRPKLNNMTVGMRMSPETKERLEEIAEHFDCTYGGKPWIAGLLEKIGSSELIVSEAPGYLLKNSTREVKRSDSKTTQDHDSSFGEINAVIEDELVERYGVLPSEISETGVCSKEIDNGSEHYSVS